MERHLEGNHGVAEIGEVVLGDVTARSGKEFTVGPRESSSTPRTETAGLMATVGTAGDTVGRRRRGRREEGSSGLFPYVSFIFRHDSWLPMMLLLQITSSSTLPRHRRLWWRQDFG